MKFPLTQSALTLFKVIELEFHPTPIPIMSPALTLFENERVLPVSFAALCTKLIGFVFPAATFENGLNFVPSLYAPEQSCPVWSRHVCPKP